MRPSGNFVMLLIAFTNVVLINVPWYMSCNSLNHKKNNLDNFQSNLDYYNINTTTTTKPSVECGSHPKIGGIGVRGVNKYTMMSLSCQQGVCSKNPPLNKFHSCKNFIHATKIQTLATILSLSHILRLYH